MILNLSMSPKNQHMERWYYSDSINAFLLASDEEVIGKLAIRAKKGQTLKLESFDVDSSFKV